MNRETEVAIASAFNVLTTGLSISMGVATLDFDHKLIPSLCFIMAACNAVAMCINLRIAKAEHDARSSNTGLFSTSKPSQDQSKREYGALNTNSHSLNSVSIS